MNSHISQFNRLIIIACVSLAISACTTDGVDTTTTANLINLEEVKAPPRDIKDILAIYEQTQQDKSLLEKVTKVLALPVPNTRDAKVLNHYYFRRASAEEALGNTEAAVVNFKKAAEDYPSTDLELRIDELNWYATAEASKGNLLRANKILEGAIAQVTKAQSTNAGYAAALEFKISSNCLSLGDIECAKSAFARSELIVQRMSGRRLDNRHRLVQQSTLEFRRSAFFISEGKYSEAASLTRLALKLNAELIESIDKSGSGDALDLEIRVVQDARNNAKPQYRNRVAMQIQMSRIFLEQRKLVDAEYWARQAVTLAITRDGVESPATIRAIGMLTNVVSEQGRSAEAVLLARMGVKSAQQATTFAAAPLIANARKVLGAALVADKKYVEADKVFSEMLAALKTNPQIAALYRTDNLDWALALIKTGQYSQALDMTSKMLARVNQHMEVKSASLALIRAFNAAALQTAGQSTQARVAFRASMPILFDHVRDDVANASESMGHAQRMTFLLEQYLAALATQTGANSSETAIDEAFEIADLARGSGVQRALNASAARANITNPQLADLARKEQDLQQRINSMSALLTDLLSAPTEQQSPGIQAKIRTSLESIKTEREAFKKEIQSKFPDYAELVDPKPASVARTRKVLKPDEILISWYFSEDSGYVWAISIDGPAKFAQLNINRNQMAKEVNELRKALDPGVATIDEIPEFNVALANQLYQQILAPIENEFKSKQVMLTVPHAELGQLPLSLLVTQPTTQPSTDEPVVFLGYKSVPWLARTIAVAQLPSVTTLTALRSLPPGSPNRKSFIGFGDPYFSAAQAKTAEKQSSATRVVTRGIPLNLRSVPQTSGVSSAELSLLPRLPDTSSELQEIGATMGASDSDVFLNVRASVKQVMSSDLSNRKVVMFATHGLVPGELNGLTQPALALSSPEVTGDKDDGLLTMDKVLTLKLNADWVVLSACNTASSDGAGSEAISGLGRAFFYAGAKALLVSSWPVDSVASRTLMTDLFKRQQQTQSSGKSALLRQAMLQQIDQGGMMDGAAMKYSYAHPLFWAPFVVVGD